MAVDGRKRKCVQVDGNELKLVGIDGSKWNYMEEGRSERESMGVD